MKKIICVLSFLLSIFMAQAQDLAFSYQQGGYNWQGRSTSDSYVLRCGNLICRFDAIFTNDSNGTIRMTVYNPSQIGFMAATYYIYPNNRFDLYANGQKIATGQWGVIQIEGSIVSFKSAPRHVHIDKHIPWNMCDICGKHKVYW